MKQQFVPGKSACPVACKYCFVTEHDARREVWNNNPVAGINKACTYINVPPWINEDKVIQGRFVSFPWDTLKGDYVGFTAITDPFWPKLENWLRLFLEKVSPVAKIVTCVTKWPLTRPQMELVSRYPNFFLVVGITGNHPPIERVSVMEHLHTLALAKEYGVRVLPICHPYIAGVSDLSFLTELRALGWYEISVKGFRYCHTRMSSWLPKSSQKYYIGKEDEEVLPEDGWREKIRAAGFGLLSPQEWYLQEGAKMGPHLTNNEAEGLVKRVFELANITSSASNEEVMKAAIRRRL